MTPLLQKGLSSRVPLIVVGALGTLDVYLIFSIYTLFARPGIDRGLAIGSVAYVIVYLAAATLGLSLLIPAATAILLARALPAIRSARLIVVSQVVLIAVSLMQLAMDPSSEVSAAHPRDRTGHLLFTVDVSNLTPFTIAITDPTRTCYDLPPDTVVKPANISFPFHCTSVRLALYKLGPSRQLFCLPDYETSATRESAGGWCGYTGTGLGFGGSLNHNVHVVVFR